MRTVYLIVFSIFLINSGTKAQDNLKTFFQKEYQNFNIDTSIKVAVPYKNKFYCLKSNGTVFTINRNNDLMDSTYEDNSKNIGLQNLYLNKDTLFGISKNKSYYLNDQNNWESLNKKFIIPPIFEDEKYIIASTCSGEWGGTIYFKEKKTNKIYLAQATCVVNVKKIKNKYNITATLAHLSGSSNIFEIEEPLSLTLYSKKHLKGKKIIYVGDNESKSTKGTNQLIDSVGIETPSSFVYNSNMFYLVSKHNETFITSIQNNKFIILDKLCNFSLWSYNPINRCYGKQTVYSFNNDKTSGFITIDDNKLKFYSFHWKHN